MTDKIIDLLSERNKRAPKPDKSELEQSALDAQMLSEYKKQIEDLYKNKINEKEVESLSKLLLFFSKRVKSVLGKVHKAAKEDPRFGLLISSVLTEIAADELLRIGLCGAVDKDDFDDYMNRIIEELGGLEYFEDFEMSDELEDFDDEEC
jgi:hypothetical protein